MGAIIRFFITLTKYPQARKRGDEVSSDEVGLAESESKKIPRGVSPWFFILKWGFKLLLWYLAQRYKAFNRKIG